MAIWRCTKCGATKEARCKPKKCPSCGEAEVMIKEGSEVETKTSCASKRGGCKKKIS